MNCEECKSQLAQLRSGEAPSPAAAAHLGTCAACAALAATERDVRAALVAVPTAVPPMARDFELLLAHAEAVAARRRHARRRLVIGLIAVTGAAALAWLAVRTVSFADLAADRSTAVWGLLGVLVAGWTAIDVVGRRGVLRRGGLGVQVGLGLARAVLVAAVVATLVHPAGRAAVDGAVQRLLPREAIADDARFEAMVMCMNLADGGLRLSSWRDQCRPDERMMPTSVGELPLDASYLPTVEYRADTAVITAGSNVVRVRFSRSMPNADYRITTAITDFGRGRMFAPDDRCRLLVVGGKTRDGFTINIRRCWFEGLDVPTDPAVEDIAVDWMAIGPR